MHRVIEKEEIQNLYRALSRDYETVGPAMQKGVVVLEGTDFDDIPAGFVDLQQPGLFRLKRENKNLFSFRPGPDSLKKFLHPSLHVLHSFEKSKGTRLVNTVRDEERPYAFIGMRACDIQALERLNSVFTGIDGSDFGYFGHREFFIVALACSHPSDNCFCSSMNAGPDITKGFDILLTELNDKFVLETGSRKGEKVCLNLKTRAATDTEREERERRIEECGSLMKKRMNVNDLPRFLYRHAESPVWKDVAERCLACGNCTQVCPTCFCNTAYDLVFLSGMRKQNEFSGRRMKKWDSCFSRNFARVHGGNFRFSRSARYRHWFNHKFGYWLDQFGVSGCVGCGRCITWCPAGIDVTEEMEKLRKGS